MRNRSFNPLAFGLLAAMLLLATVFPRHLDASAQGIETNREMTYLINEIRRSPAVFIRNGQSYPGSAAAEHIKAKAEYYRAEIQTAEDFIRLAATKSALTGVRYQVRQPDGTLEPCDVWLTRLLLAYRAKPK